jgi:hypothetical protein
VKRHRAYDDPEQFRKAFKECMSVENKDKDKYYGEYAMKMHRELLIFNGDPSVEVGD